MDQSYQFYLFMLSTTTLFTDIKPTEIFSHTWFDAQEHCLGQGLSVEGHNSDKPYWTGFYRRLSPWINILGCYSDSVELIPTVVKKTMVISSVGECQELCRYENYNKFAVKMNNCLCIERNVFLNPSNKLTPSACNYTCGDQDDIVSGDCGGERAYNLFEYQEVKFNSVETCLSLQCYNFQTRFIPKNCSEHLHQMCEYWEIPDNGYAGSWSSSMEQCKNSHTPYYLLGDIQLKFPHIACLLFHHKFQVFWVGFTRRVYISIDKGAIDELALKISFPVITVFIILLLSVMAVVFCSRRKKMTKADRTTKEQKQSGPRKNVDSNVDCVQNKSYFVLERCPQYISKRSDSTNVSPYNNSEDGVYDHLRDKISRKPEVEDTYQHASAGVFRDMFEYDTMAKAVNKKQEEDASYDYSRQDINGNYECDLRAQIHLTGDPYDVAV